MKKIKWYLLLAVIAGIGAAFANRPSRPSFPTMHHYAFTHKNLDGTRMYYSKDLTDAGYQKGIDYDCVPPINICTFLGDITREHSDLTGMYFFTSDIPSSGIDNSGIFEDLDQP